MKFATNLIQNCPSQHAQDEVGGVVCV